MQQDRTSPSDIAAEVVAEGGKLHPVLHGRKTLAESLGSTVDQIRQIATDLGVRPYRVWLVHWQWPRKPGLGVPRETSRREILPTPRVMDLSGVPLSLASVGLTEMGGIKVDRISQRFSEDDLTGRTPDLRDPVRDATNREGSEFFYEVRETRTTVPPTKPRRFIPANVPMLRRSGMEWSIMLNRQEYTFDPDRVERAA